VPGPQAFCLSFDCQRTPVYSFPRRRRVNRKSWIQNPWTTSNQPSTVAPSSQKSRPDVSASSPFLHCTVTTFCEKAHVEATPVSRRYNGSICDNVTENSRGLKPSCCMQKPARHGAPGSFRSGGFVFSDGTETRISRIGTNRWIKKPGREETRKFDRIDRIYGTGLRPRRFTLLPIAC
jgi:hypothetical protein